jgi:hypothetical protein
MVAELYRHLGLSNYREPARRGVPKLRRYQLVSALRWPRHNIMQAIIAHGRELLFVYRQISSFNQQQLRNFVPELRTSVRHYRYKLDSNSICAAVDRSAA